MGPDPVHGSFQVGYKNTGAGSAEATITSSRLIFSDMKAWSFKVTPAGSGMLGGMTEATVAHVKQDGSGSGEAGPCNYCNQMWTLEVTWNVGGATVTDTLGPQQVSCVF